MLSFDGPTGILSAKIRKEGALFLGEYSLLDMATAMQQNQQSSGSPSMDLRKLQHDRADALVLSRKDSLTQPHLIVLSVPVDSQHGGVPLSHPGRESATRELASALRTSINVSRRYESFAGALAAVIQDNTMLSLPHDIVTASSNTQGTATGLEGLDMHQDVKIWTSLLCSASLTRITALMEVPERRCTLLAMDEWFREGGGLPVELAGSLAACPRRELLRCGVLRLVGALVTASLTLPSKESMWSRSTDAEEGGVYAVFLFSDILLVARSNASGGSSPLRRKSCLLSQQLTYTWHCLLTECSMSATSRHSYAENTLSICGRGRRFEFESASPTSPLGGARCCKAWLHSCSQALGKAQHISREEARLERYQGAVVFADISGFSNLGEALEGQAAEQRQTGGLQGPRTLAAEQLAKVMDEEVNKMVESVVEGGGDVIQFAGDCVIAVFPAADYERLDSPDGSDEYGAVNALSRAAGQAVHVARSMVEKRDDFVKEQLATLRRINSTEEVVSADRSIQQLQDELNIHVAVGAGLIYGYHAGGVDNKWHYVIDGPAMQQVRAADPEAGAGEVVLSRETRQLLKSFKMRLTPTPTGNFKVGAYFGPTREPRANRRGSTGGTVRPGSIDASPYVDEESGLPWEGLKSPRLRGLLADKLRAYIPQPVVDQIDDGQFWSLGKRRTISTMFCKLHGIDYAVDHGEQAVVQLGAMITQIQATVHQHHGTVTRVSCDDKGTSLLIVYDVAQEAVDSGLEIVSTVRHLPDLSGRGYCTAASKYRALVGITTGEVWLGVVGGETRAEYTMHGSVVNFAARLMTCKFIAEEGGVLCDGVTAQQAKLSEWVTHPPSIFKGFELPIHCYQPVGRKNPAVLAASTESCARTRIASTTSSSGRFSHSTDSSSCNLDHVASFSSSSLCSYGDIRRTNSKFAGSGAGVRETRPIMSHTASVTLQTAAVLATASLPNDGEADAAEGALSIVTSTSRFGRFSSSCLVAAHPLLGHEEDENREKELCSLVATELEQLVEMGKLVACGADGDGGVMYSFSCLKELKNRYHELQAEDARDLHRALAPIYYSTRLHV